MVFYFLKVILLVFSKNACVVTNYEFGQITSLKLNVESVERFGGGGWGSYQFHTIYQILICLDFCPRCFIRKCIDFV